MKALSLSFVPLFLALAIPAFAVEPLPTDPTVVPAPTVSVTGQFTAIAGVGGESTGTGLYVTNQAGGQDLIEVDFASPSFNRIRPLFMNGVTIQVTGFWAQYTGIENPFRNVLVAKTVRVLAVPSVTYEGTFVSYQPQGFTHPVSGLQLKSGQQIEVLLGAKQKFIVNKPVKVVGHWITADVQTRSARPVLVIDSVVEAN